MLVNSVFVPLFAGLSGVAGLMSEYTSSQESGYSGQYNSHQIFWSLRRSEGQELMQARVAVECVL
jgi:hypothetical protein